MSILSLRPQARQLNLVSPSVADRRLEAAIDAAFAALISTTNDMRRRAAWRAMTKLISQRSPAQIERMELKQGLRSPPSTWRPNRCGVCAGPVANAHQWLCASCAQPSHERAA